VHDLKTWPEQFQALWFGRKKHEVRKNDRNYKVNDNLILREWDPDTKAYSGRKMITMVDYVTAGGSFGLPKEICVMSLTVLTKERLSKEEIR
jgi:hypothetical protein